MNLNQTNELNMLDAELLTLAKYNTTWSGNPVMVTAVNSLQAKVNNLNAMDQAQKATTKGITLGKVQARTAMNDFVYTHIQAGRAYATANNNTTLKETLHYSHSDLKRLKDTDADDVCQIVHDAVAPYISGMANYGATTASLTALQTAINTFSVLIGKPRSQKAATVAATKSVSQLLTEARTINKDTLDPLIEQYKSSNTAFYKEYHTSRIKVDIGSHTVTILSGKVTDGTNPVEHALIKLRNTTKMKKTDAKGTYKFMRLAAGTYVIDVSAQGYKPASVNVTITENEINKVNIIIEKL